MRLRTCACACCCATLGKDWWKERAGGEGETDIQLEAVKRRQRPASAQCIACGGNQWLRSRLRRVREAGEGSGLAFLKGGVVHTMKQEFGKRASYCIDKATQQ